MHPGSATAIVLADRGLYIVKREELKKQKKSRGGKK
jgi:hypothetical protein